MALKMKKGDLLPNLRFYDIRNENGALVDVSTATSVHVIAHRGRTFLFDRDCSDAATTSGEVTMEWQAGDTDEVGRIKLELVIEVSLGHEITIPNEGYFEVIITEDLSIPED